MNRVKYDFTLDPSGPSTIFERGYLCTVAEDACLSSAEEDHVVALRSLRKFYAWVTSTAEIISLLQRQ